jgi:hypothetical protein
MLPVKDEIQCNVSPAALVQVKKSYSAPRLIEYGDIVTLTRGTGVYNCDAAHMKRTRPHNPPCT